MSLDVVAEGIEQPAQLGALQALGCRLGQGFYFARPLTATAVNALVTAGGLPSSFGLLAAHRVPLHVAVPTQAAATPVVGRAEEAAQQVG